MSKKHYKFSASASDRWTNCYGSIQLSQKVPKSSGESLYAVEGTVAHDLAESMLNNPDLYSGIVISDKSMLHYVKEYVDYVGDILGSMPPHVEERLEYNPDFGGTIDFFCIRKNRVDIVDLKFGRGVGIDAFKNRQLMSYALCVRKNYPETQHVDTFRVHIFQPRRNNISVWEFDNNELDRYELRVERAMSLSDVPNPKFKPGVKWCRWCSARNICTALEDTIVELVGDIPDDSDIIISDTTLKILTNKDVIIDYLKSLEANVFNRLMMGHNVEGFKLIQGRSITQYTVKADEVLQAHLGDKAYQKKLLPISKLKPLVGTDVMDQITFKPKGKPKLVSSDTVGRPYVSVESKLGGVD